MSTAGNAGAPIAAAELATLPAGELEAFLARCCGARAWIEAMAAGLRGRATLRRDDVLALAERSFDRLRREDWLEAFAGHPRIGDLSSLRQRFASTADLAASEQAGSRRASDRVLAALARGNAEYEARFGHLFIVCATGKSADEMLEILRRRLANPPERELEIAAAEQRRITRLRLEGALSDEERRRS